MNDVGMHLMENAVPFSLLLFTTNTTVVWSEEKNNRFIKLMMTIVLLWYFRFQHFVFGLCKNGK